MRNWWLRLMPMFEGDGGGSGAGSGGEGTGGNGTGEGSSGDSGGGEGDSGGEKTLTEAEAQAKIDAAVKDRLAREKKKNDAALKKLQAQLDELSGKKPEDNKGADGEGDDAAAVKAQAILAQANQRVVNAVAQTEAVKLGVDPKYVADVVRLADLSKAEVDENGNVDAAVVSKALDEVLKRVPVFKGNQEGNNGGFRVGGEGGQGQKSGNGWKKDGEQGAPKRWNRWT